MTGQTIHLGMTVINTSADGGGLPKLFITSNTSLNGLTFTIANSSETPVTLTNDQVFTVSPPAGLLNEDQFNGVGVAGPDWKITPHSGRFTYWTVHPSNPITVANGQPASFQFKNLAISNKSDQGKGLFWDVAWNGFGNVAGGLIQRKIFVYLPVKEDLNMAAVLDTGTQILPVKDDGQPIGNYLPAYSVPYFPQSNKEVFISAPGTNRIYTQHKIYLNNTGDEIKFSGDSQFVLNFTICEDNQTDINALCRASNFKDIAVTQIYNDPSKKWQTVQQQGQGPQMTWLLQPGNGLVLGHSESAYFQISAIYTTLPTYLTDVYVSYAGIPKTSPGLLHFDLVKKVTPPAVPVLTVDGHPVPRDPEELLSRRVNNPLDVGLEQQVELGWATVGVTEAQLDPKEGNNISVGLNGPYPWTPYPTANARGAISLITKPLVEGGNQWGFNLKSPVIDSLLANGQNPSAQDFGPFVLSWKTRYASAVTLKNQDGKVLAHYEQQNNPAAVDHGSYLHPFQQTEETFTLTAEGYKGPHEKTVKVTMNPVAIDSFLADGENPLSMKAGPVTFDWKTRNALSVTILDQSGTSIAHYERATDRQKMDQGNYVLPLAAYDQTYSLHADGIHSSGHQKVQVNAKRPFTLTYNPTPGPGAKGGSFDLDYDFSKVTYDYVNIFLAYFTVPDNLILYLQLKKLSGPTKKGPYTFLVSPDHWYGGWPSFLKKGTPLKIDANLVFFPNSQDPPFFDHVWTYEIKFLE